MPDLSDLTISIISHGHGPLLSKLLEDLSLIGAIPRSRVIVTLNIPDAATPKGRWEHANIEWVENPRPKGFASNHNAALLRASTDWVLALNPDIRIAGPSLAGLLQTASREPDLGILAPLILSSDGHRQDSVRQNLSPVAVVARLFRRLLCGTRDSGEGDPLAMEWFAGMFMLMPRTVFAALHGFDERFFLYCEDYDLCARASLLGKRLIFDAAHPVIHDAQRSSRRNPRYMLWHVASLLRVWCSSTFWRFTAGRLLKRIPPVRAAQPPRFAGGNG